MRLSRELKFGRNRVEIYEVENLVDQQEAWGTCEQRHDEQDFYHRICLVRDDDSFISRRVLFHELLHLFSDHAGLEFEEATVVALENCFLTLAHSEPKALLEIFERLCHDASDPVPARAPVSPATARASFPTTTPGT